MAVNASNCTNNCSRKYSDTKLLLCSLYPNLISLISKLSLEYQVNVKHHFNNLSTHLKLRMLSIVSFGTAVGTFGALKGYGHGLEWTYAALHNFCACLENFYSFFVLPKLIRIESWVQVFLPPPSPKSNRVRHSNEIEDNFKHTLCPPCSVLGSQDLHIHNLQYLQELKQFSVSLALAPTWLSFQLGQGFYCVSVSPPHKQK